ncbi:15-cis-zeta-carotene isomerase (A), partial [Gracilaria domingensis]
LRLGIIGWLSALAVPTILAYLDAHTAHGMLTDHLGTYASHYYMVLYNALFALLHSGLASLRPLLTRFTGERIYRIGFALASLPSAVGLIAYFIAHRYDGKALWTLQGVPYMHALCYTITFISFLMLYPATFNLLEVAAVKKPSFKIYETGIIRISRHPQLVGQALWCLAHGAWMGTSFTLVACLTLLAQHLVGAWNGDRRLRDKYEEEWLLYAERTSVVPFASIINGKQSLRLNEFGLGYIGVVLFVLGTYAAHPWMLRVVGSLE